MPNYDRSIEFWNVIKYISMYTIDILDFMLRDVYLLVILLSYTFSTYMYESKVYVIFMNFQDTAHYRACLKYLVVV